MVRGIYAAGTGMLLQRRKMETITSNLTNVETSGYKKNYLVSHSFDDVLLERINDPSVTMNYYAGPYNFGTQVDQVYLDFTQGSFEPTGLSTDLAIAGDGFFVMETEGGERYTRASAFYLNAEGCLTDGEGHYLLGENGRLRVMSDDFSVNTNGDIFINGEYYDTIRVVQFEDNSVLRSQGSNLFSAEAEPVQATDFEVKQGFLEGSNVQAAREMVDMITVYRAYETNQRMLTMYDEIVGKAVNEIGGLR